MNVPVDGVEFPQILRGPGHAWWRSALGVLLALAAVLFLTALVNRGVVALAWILTDRGTDFTDYARSAYAVERPSGMVAAGLAVATLAPISWALVLLVHRVRPRWLSSVRPGLRRRYLLAALAIAMIVMPVAGWLPVAVSSRPGWELRPGLTAFVLVILLITPLQAAAEEVFFRGYLLQAFGSLVRGPWFGIAMSALVFAVLHGGQSPAMFVDRLALGLLAGVLVWRTGGLEAAIAGHVVSNVVVYLNGAFTTSVAAVRATAQIGWLDAVSDVAVFGVFTVLAVLLARRLGLRRQVDLTRRVDPVIGR